MMHDPHGDNQQERDSFVKQQGKKLVRDKAMKAIKKFGKVALKVGAKALLAAGKALLGLLAGIGLPYLLIIGGVILGLLLIYLATTLLFSSNDESLSPEQRELSNHVIEVANSTVDMSKPEQVPYRVPPELIISALQIYDSSKHGVSEKEAATIMGEALAPIFTFGNYEGLIEEVVTVCVEGEEECTSVPSETPFEINYVESVEAWDRVLTANYSEYTTDWETASSSSTETVQVPKKDANGVPIPGQFIEDEITTRTTVKSRVTTMIDNSIGNEDYTYFDRVLSEEPFGYGINDKLTTEALYQATGGEIRYKEWLSGNSLAGFNGTVTPGSSVPSQYMEYYLAAEKAYKVDWFFVAAIHFVETGFSTHPTMMSSVGAEGHTQFMPCSWLGWAYPGCVGGNGFIDVGEDIKFNPKLIKQYGGYGIDADKNGKATPWDIKDALFTTASYLNKNGFAKNVDKAIRAYNHSDIYVRDVKEAANRFKNEATYSPSDGTVPNLAPGSFMKPAKGTFSSGYGPRAFEKRSFHYGIDIANPEMPPIVAAADGVISKLHTGCPKIGSRSSTCGDYWGNHVWIKHNVGGQQFEAVYGHFSAVGVSLNQEVKQGQFLGYMGTSGSSTGVHLHFELHLGSRNKYKNVLNPTMYIPHN
ncbi:MAG: peptidoglycan DD-metalloendopeptidase family protein [Paenisporosarcina sp.]|nr:peptidoglycan DD-metalloendopeptidase family protein [Paenisporosarcina sp.]